MSNANLASILLKFRSTSAAYASTYVAHAHRASTATATLAAHPWAPPAPTMRIPTIFPDSLEVLIFSTEAGPTLVAAIELVSPSNKDREEHCRAFAAKCSSYVQQGIGLMIVDIVTNRQANLHNAFVRLLHAGESFLLSEELLYATAYRPVRREDTDEIEVWPATLTVGRSPPVCLCPWIKPSVCRSILAPHTARRASVVGCPPRLAK